MSEPRPSPWRILGLVASVGLALATYWEWVNRFEEISSTSPAETTRAVPRKIGFQPIRTVTKGYTKQSHSSSAIELPNGDLRCFWFGGTREGHKDVSIWTARWDHQLEEWGASNLCLERLWLEEATGLNIRKLGNPVAFIHEGQVELFVVGVSVGGWSGSAIYHLSSADEGRSFQNPRRLTTSPFFNLSTLVRTTPVRTSSGDSLILPSYHEFIHKFPTRIGFDKDRNISFVATTPAAKDFIQPMEVSLDGRTLSFLRDCRVDGAVHLLTDPSESPATPHELPIPNSDSNLAALALDNGILLACNDTTNDRTQLSLLFQKSDALDHPWHRLRMVETPERQADELNEDMLRYSYPSLLQTRDGMLHLFYTWHHREIRHLRFDAKDWPAAHQPTAP